jgi:hypothetical protein
VIDFDSLYLHVGCGVSATRSTGFPSHANITRAILTITIRGSTLRIRDLAIYPILSTVDDLVARNSTTAALDTALKVSWSSAVSSIRFSSLGRAKRSLHTTSRAVRSGTFVVSAATDIRVSRTQSAGSSATAASSTNAHTNTFNTRYTTCGRITTSCNGIVVQVGRHGLDEHDRPYDEKHTKKGEESHSLQNIGVSTLFKKAFEAGKIYSARLEKQYGTGNQTNRKTVMT